jgi:hypothetical protein
MGSPVGIVAGDLLAKLLDTLLYLFRREKNAFHIVTHGMLQHRNVSIS